MDNFLTFNSKDFLHLNKMSVLQVKVCSPSFQNALNVNVLRALIFTTESWQPSAGVAAWPGLNLACYRLDTQSCCWEQNVSLSTHEEVQCTLDKMLPLDTPTHTHPPTHTHTHTHTHTLPILTSPSLPALPLRSVYLTSPGWQAAAAPLLGSVRVHTGGCKFPEQLEQIWEVPLTRKATHTCHRCHSFSPQPIG